MNKGHKAFFVLYMYIYIYKLKFYSNNFVLSYAGIFSFGLFFIALAAK